MSLTRMNRILEIDEENITTTIQAGVVTATCRRRWRSGLNCGAPGAASVPRWPTRHPTSWERRSLCLAVLSPAGPVE
jgi:hypothetical protein